MIEDKLKETTLLFFELEYLKSDLISISNKDSNYFKIIVENSPSFIRIYRNSFKLFVIELAKIVDSKEDFSLLKLVDYIISNRKNLIWKNSEMKMSRLNFIREEIKKIEDLHLENIKNLRDKFYAHTDKDRHKIELIFSLQIGFEILGTLRQFYEEIVLKINNQHIAFSVFSSLTNEMVLLQRYKLIQKFITTNLKEKGNIGELQKVRDIMLGKVE
ncbi:hypothetical protein IVB69_05665 [Flavobacterium sp. J49]|uniref:AbiU2 domain-containing protein n=1 Tax=Flavobacterium sp. J49 TaxID=2718534 RepID=UPI0015943583|nr:hypothetical protein [Flavobacterium sp. J49]MBF6640959.1 hypothetical protein [Flavobacterium sp. J49]NIC02206.1 hypothetical protein [Flavobacterium sp. J49]